jgi:hypothetical protein
VVQIVPADSETGTEINKVFLKETEKTKYRPSAIVQMMYDEGFGKFRIKDHTDLWQSRDAKNAKYQYGTYVEPQWYWYESWLTEVRKYCQDSGEKFRLEPLVLEDFDEFDEDDDDDDEETV